MPIELEYKYVLKDIEQLLELVLPLTYTNFIKGCVDIDQGYLGKGGRVRKRDWYSKDGEMVDLTEWIFTYKHDLSSQPGCLEIETPITEDDYLLAWDESTHKITKTRYLIPCVHDQGVWEVDFFKDQRGLYFAMAEFEVPANSGPPEKIHPLLEKFLLYPVPNDDKRFKNRKLNNREHIEKLLKEFA